MEKNQIFKNIMNRTSVRSYTEKPVEQEKVEMMLRAGTVSYTHLTLPTTPYV